MRCDTEPRGYTWHRIAPGANFIMAMEKIDGVRVIDLQTLPALNQTKRVRVD